MKNAHKELKDYDSELKPKKDVLYVESIATKPKARDIKIFLRILNVIKEEAEKRTGDSGLVLD